MAKEKGKVFDWKVINRIFALTKAHKGTFLLSGALACGLSLLGPLRPYLIQKAIDDHILQMDWSGLQVMILILIGVLIGESLCRYFFLYVSNWFGQTIIQEMRKLVFDHISKLKLRYYDTNPIGGLSTRTINDIEAVNAMFTSGLVNIFADILTILLVLVFMCLADLTLTGLTLLSLPLMFLATYVFQKRVRGATQKVRTQISKMNAFLQEYLTGIQIVQVFVKDNEIVEEFDKINKKHAEAHVETILYYSIFFPVVELLIAVSIGIILWYGGILIVEDGTMSLGGIISFILYIHILFRPIRQLADKFGTLQTGIISSERIFEVLDNQSIIPDDGTVEPNSLSGKIEFQHVDFAYDGETKILKDINFLVQPGETIAFVGATGAGKSSIINVLSRFYEYQNGTVLIDDVALEDYKLDALRKHIGVVLQDVFLFSGSILENITLRNENISKEKVIEAAKLVGVDEMICRLPGGYDYEVGERGITLSLGQRQLISFVRALVYNPKILVLDEATSSIDTESEMLIQSATEKLVQNRTSIIIAHRLSTIQHSDKIMVLDKGEIVEMGSPEELMKKENGWYRNLYEKQFKLQELD